MLHGSEYVDVGGSGDFKAIFKKWAGKKSSIPFVHELQIEIRYRVFCQNFMNES